MVSQSDMWDTDSQTWLDDLGLFEWSSVQQFHLNSEVTGNEDKEFYFDRIRIVNGNTLVKQKPETLPGELSLAANYPNPFNPTTTIQYQLPTRSAIELAVYDLRGALVKILESGVQSAGSHSVVWDGTNSLNQSVGNGVYIYRLKTFDQTISKRMVLIR